MKIVEMRECTIPLQGKIRNSLVSFEDHTVSLVALISDQKHNGKPIVGYGFNSIGRYGQAGILRERIFPRIHAASSSGLLNADESLFDATAIAEMAMQNEKPGGHGDRAGAVGAIELAVWDLNAKLVDEPAYRIIARHFSQSATSDSTSVYAAGGYYYSADSVAKLQTEFLGYKNSGFDSFKMKIGGATLPDDLERIESVLNITGSGSKLAVDANGRFDLQLAIDYGKAMEGYGLRWYEEPGDPLDYLLNSKLAKAYPGPIATGENLFSVADTLNLVRFGGLREGKDIFQMDPGLSYGLTEYASILQVLENHGFDRRQCFPHGGHLINLHIAVGLGLGGCEAYPGVFQPFGGYSPQCRIEGGRVWPTDAPGFGLEQKQELLPYLESLS